MLLGTLTIAIPAVQAYNYENWGYSSNLYTTNWLQWDGEAQATSTAFGEIADLFAQQTFWVYWYLYGWIPYGPTYGEVQNWGSSATADIFYDQIVYDIYHHYDFATVLYVGHGGPVAFYLQSDDPDNPDNPPEHNASFNIISSIMQTHSCDDFRFVLMWVCMGGENSPEGSPSAWNPLWWSNPPAHPPYTWIGFDGLSPWLVEGMDTYGVYGQENIYKYWLVFFYYYALLNGNSVMDALNYASVATGFSNYGSSILAEGYESYWPYHQFIQGEEFFPGDYPGNMHVAGHPYATHVPGDLYYWID
jgi:hypothetical protein